MAAVDILTLAFFKLWERNLIPYQERIQFPGLVSGHMALGISFLVFTLLAYLFDARLYRYGHRPGEDVRAEPAGKL